MASSPYQPEAWHDFFVMAGGAAGALTGLLFVALSLHLHQVAGNSEHRSREPTASKRGSPPGLVTLSGFSRGR